MWPIKSIASDKQALFWGYSTYIDGVSKMIDGKTFIFKVNLGMWSLKLIISENEPCSEGFNTHIYGVSKKIDGKTFIFKVNLGMWSLKSIILGFQKWALFWRFQHTFMEIWGFQGDRWENIYFLE